MNDGFVTTLLTVHLPYNEGILDVKLRDLPVPNNLLEIFALPLGRLAIKHGPRHWLMDRSVVTDTHAVLVCRECQLRLETPARTQDLFSLILFWNQRYGSSSLHLEFNCNQKSFNGVYAKRLPPRTSL
jgi:hypothetical protein